MLAATAVFSLTLTSNRSIEQALAAVAAGEPAAA